jgi:hypothetical protein
MFFRSPKKRRPPHCNTSGSSRAQGEQLLDWRRSAQKVTRAWNAWLAADARDRAARYTDYAAALAAEERAAARVECMLRPHETRDRSGVR